MSVEPALRKITSAQIPVRSFTDADLASSLLSSHYATVRLEPLTIDDFDLQVSYAGLTGMGIYCSSSRSGVNFTSVEYFDGFTLSVMRRGVMNISTGPNDLSLSVEKDLVVDAATVERVAMSPGSQFLGLAINAGAIKSALAERIGGHVPRRIVFSKDNTSPSLRLAYESILNVIYSGLGEGGALRENPMALKNLEDALMNMVLFGAEHSYSEALFKGTIEMPGVVRRAIEFMRTNAHLPITTTDVALELGVGLRSLQLSFQRWLDTTPHNYLRNLRMNSAREDLLTGQHAKIIDVARKWGFNSPGEFSRLYQIAFGERPMETLRQNQSQLIVQSSMLESDEFEPVSRWQR